MPESSSSFPGGRSPDDPLVSDLRRWTRRAAFEGAPRARVPVPDRRREQGHVQDIGKRCAPYEAKTSPHVVGPIDMLASIWCTWFNSKNWIE